MYSAPDKLLKDYYSHYSMTAGSEARAEPEGGLMPYEKWREQFKRADPDQIEEMAEFLRTEKYPAMKKEEFEGLTKMQEWRDDQPSWYEVIGSRMAKRGAELGAGMLTTMDGVAEWLEKQVPLGGIDLDTGEYLSGKELEKRGGADVLKKGSKGLRDWDLKYSDYGMTTWEEVKEEPFSLKFMTFALEMGLVSLPDMVAAVAHLPTYVAMRTGELGHARAENDLRDKANVTDLLKALPAATASALLERIGAKGIFGMTDKLKNASLKEIGKTVAKRTGREALTEAIQEPIEATGEQAWTKAWQGKSAAEIGMELGERSLQGAVVGLGFGGAVSTGTTGAQAGRGRTEEAMESDKAKIKAAVEKAMEQAAEQRTAADAKAEVPGPDTTPTEGEATAGLETAPADITGADADADVAGTVAPEGEPVAGLPVAPSDEAGTDIEAEQVATTVVPEGEPVAGIPEGPAAVSGADAEAETLATGAPATEGEAVAGLPEGPAAEAGTDVEAEQPPGGVPAAGEPLAGIPEEERSIESMTIEEEANLGNRRLIPPWRFRSATP